MVLIAIVLVPLHHKIETYITKIMIVKNRKHKLAAAKKALEKLQTEQSQL